MSVPSVSINLNMSASEEFTAAEQPNAASAADRTLKVNALNLNQTLNSNSTPKCDSPPIYRKITFPSGALITIDLTAAPGLKSPDSATRAIDLTGKKLKHLMMRCASTNNAAGVLVAYGAANPYPLFGASKSILMLPGEVIAMGFNAVESTKPAVAAAVKTIDITPGAAGDIWEIEMAFGT